MIRSRWPILARAISSGNVLAVMNVAYTHCRPTGPAGAARQALFAGMMTCQAGARQAGPHELARLDRPGDRVIAWADGLQRRHGVLGFPYAVVKKYGDDEGGRQAALITYYGFLSIFPLLLLGVAVLTRALADHPDLRRQLTAAIVPPALRPTIEHSLATLPTSTIPLVLGLIGLLFSGTGVVFSAYQTLNHVAAVPHARLWPRALDLTRPTAADTRALTLLAREQERIPAARVTFHLAAGRSAGTG
jgi:Virulence factor BrkB